MVFSSIIFLYLFLPVTLSFYFAFGRKARNTVLLIASLLFYSWGELGYVVLMLFSVFANWIFGQIIEREQQSGRTGKFALVCGVVINLIPLAYFKYSGFVLENVNFLLPEGGGGELSFDDVHLPIGISFYTFQAISYVVDVYRRDAKAQSNPTNLALYICLFPQLIAGPIVRYHDVASQILDRNISLEDFRYGLVRFVAGLGKKVLIANNMGLLADHVFTLPPESIPASLAWLGILAYTLQIYFDFSGYSDMAIGLGRMFGFRFLENFSYPYIARSIKEFWRRWHISLSNWIRDYLYLPLGGNRKGQYRTYVNLLIVFALCGFWHGASWSFVVWGLYHGLFLIFERGRFGVLLSKAPGILQHIYTLLVVSIGWVFFRSESLEYAVNYIMAMFTPNTPDYLDAELFGAMNSGFYLALVVGTLLSAPLVPWVSKKIDVVLLGHSEAFNKLTKLWISIVILLWSIVILIVCTSEIISGTHNPFLYFRF